VEYIYWTVWENLWTCKVSNFPVKVVTVPKVKEYWFPEVLEVIVTALPLFNMVVDTTGWMMGVSILILTFNDPGVRLWMHWREVVWAVVVELFKVIVDILP
jgi:hypothetical protein